MKVELNISAEELAELDALVQREIENTHVELRRTRNPQFRSELQQHVERMEHLLRQLAQSPVPAGTK